MARNMLVRAKIFMVDTRFHADIDVHPVTPIAVFHQNNSRIQKARVGISLCVQLTSLHYFL